MVVNLVVCVLLESVPGPTSPACFRGGAVVPLRPSLAPEMLLTILQDSGADLVVLGDKDHLQIILDSFATDGERSLPDLTTALVIGDLLDELEELPPGVVLMNSVLFETPTPALEEQERIRSHAISISPQATASIPYVIGETGRPKGAVFDHARCMATLRHIAKWFTFEEDDVAFTVGSLSTVAHLAATLHYFRCGIVNVVVGADDSVGEQLQQASPTTMLATPHAFERIYDEVMGNVARMPESSQAVFQWALAKGREYQAAGSDASPERRQEYTRADMTFFSQLRGQLGGRMRRLYSTGASLSQEVDAFFQAIGLPLLNVYSLTEAGGFPAVSQPDDL